MRRTIARHLYPDIYGGEQRVHNWMDYPTLDAEAFSAAYRFTFIRDPLERAISCFREKLRDPSFNTAGFRNGCSRAIEQHGFHGHMRFPEFARHLATIPDDEADNHIRSSYSVLTHYGAFSLPHDIMLISEIPAFVRLLDERGFRGIEHAMSSISAASRNISDLQPMVKARPSAEELMSAAPIIRKRYERDYLILERNVTTADTSVFRRF